MTKRPNPLDRYARDLSPGELTWIGVRPRRRESLLSVKVYTGSGDAWLRG
jgi:hypothetical protein